ncbi:MAG: hypothetical protein O7H41_20765 [Planctomycetota bacterium]|nr:hypothetical protein [Planctomycetota bacterium]
MKLSITKGLIQQYHRLLREEWSEQTIGQAIGLLDIQLANAGLVFSIEPPDLQTEAKPETSAESVREYRIPPSATETLRAYLKNLNMSIRQAGRPRPSARLASKRDRELKLATINAAHYLTFPVWFHEATGTKIELSGETGFFEDVRSVLFCSVAFELVPQLRGAKWSNSQAFLLNALWLHSTLFWEHNPSHQYYLKSLLYGILKDPESELEALYHAFRLANPRHHDYITRAYAYWFHLAEHGELQRAALFSLQLFRRVTPDHLDKVREMVFESFASLYGGSHRQLLRPSLEPPN